MERTALALGVPSECIEKYVLESPFLSPEKLLIFLYMTTVFVCPLFIKYI
jgi:hypothetical protein